MNKFFQFLTNPKNARMIILAGFIILVLLLLHQCNRSKGLKNELEKQKTEAQRAQNNYEASKGSIRQYKLDDSTWRAEKLGYELTLDELKGKYADLLGDFKVEKNKPPKVVIKTIVEIKEVIREVPVLVEIDENGGTNLVFRDSTRHNTNNYRVIDGRIPYKIVFSEKDSTYNLVPGNATLGLELGMNLNLGLFQDKKTKKVSIIADTDYPGITFTKLEGASIMDDPKNKQALRSMRKTWGLGLNLGYGAVVNPSSGSVNLGPYFGLGLSYNPKFLQWGK